MVHYDCWGCGLFQEGRPVLEMGANARFFNIRDWISGNQRGIANSPRQPSVNRHSTDAERVRKVTKLDESCEDGYGQSGSSGGLKPLGLAWKLLLSCYGGMVHRLAM